MSINKLALIRYKTIDECLQNRFRKWTLEDLIEKVSDALDDYEGIKTGVSKRTIQADIQLMRSDKLGYNAPIVIKDKKYYVYEDKNYSISKVAINPKDVEKLKDILVILKQFSGFNYFSEMEEVILKLENNLNKSTQKTKNYIQFEGNQNLKGINHITPLYKHILKKQTLYIEYKSFSAKESQTHIYYPYLLKEFRNRWFLIAKRKGSIALFTLPLDRIIDFKVNENEDFLDTDIDFEQYYDNLIGVTKSQKNNASLVVLEVNQEHSPYILTKPLHHSQKTEKISETSTIISIKVVLNFELQKEILSFGDGIKVLSPRILANQIKRRLENAKNLYSI
ncbi:MAG: WYL domain-containing protein [Bacteroidetes bacterium]|nr:MAG: WYL domain-containing protein [Bacteroidota bacterium]